MEKLLKKSGIQLPASAISQLWQYHNLLRKRNQDQDLTRLIGFETIVIKHYIDSMIVGDLFPLPSPLADIGTGAGFPGIPLKIRYPHLKLTLAEPRPRRITFLKEACALLKFKGVDVFEHKVVSESFKTPVAGIITRALETMDKTILRTTAATKKGSQYIFLKGPNAQEELDEVLKRFKNRIHLIFDKEYTLPGTENNRRLIVLERAVD